MGDSNLYVAALPAVEEIAETKFAVIVSETALSDWAGYSKAELTEEEAQAISGFSHFFTWNYRDVDTSLQVLQADKVNAQQLRSIGKFLYKQMFAGKALRMLEEHITRASEQESRVMLRLMLQSPSLNAVPWEYIYYPPRKTYLSLLPEVYLARLQPSHISREQQMINLSLKVLLVDCRFDKQERDYDLSRLKDELNQCGDNLEVDLIRSSSRNALQDDLEERLTYDTFQAVHFFAHVEASSNEAYFLLPEKERSWTVYGVPMLESLLLKSNVRLVVITPCGSKGRPWNVNFIGARVHEIGVPALITTQVEFTDQWITDFAQSFYPALARKGSVDQALADTRQSLARRSRASVGAFALFLSTPDSTLFDLVAKEVGQGNIKDTLKSVEPTRRQSVLDVVQAVAKVAGGSIGTSLGGEMIGTTMGSVIINIIADKLSKSGEAENYLREGEKREVSHGNAIQKL